MSKTGPASTLTEGQKFEFSGAVMRQMPRVLEGANPARIQSFINNQDALVLLLREAVVGVPLGEIDRSVLLLPWQKFYKKHFGLEKDFANLVIPPKPEGDWRLLVIAEGMTANRLYAKCAELFRCWRYVNDFSSVTSDRNANKDYCVWVRRRVEADEENKNLSANDCGAKNIQGETLSERLLHELVYFTESGSHLDIVNITLCSGSRSRYGSVPSVGWYRVDGRMNVSAYSPDDRIDDLRTRTAVS